MNIQRIAYDLAKSIMDAPRRDHVRALIQRLNSATKESDTKNRSDFGYHARQMRCQALGYLLIDQNRDELPIRFAPLNDKERAALESFHNELAWLNKACLGAAFAETSISPVAADPYGCYRYEPTEAQPRQEFLGEESRRQLIDTFKSHPSVAQARATVPPGLFAGISAKNYIGSISRMGHAIEGAGVHEAPDDVVKRALLRDSHSVELGMFRHLTAMASVRITPTQI